ncbi:MAG: aminotransferase class I/II-fold pyridoxal phosphate-dependent enzyme [Candidatus Hydrogenedentes bacterium]|nr:aminotransferase class I/II-fold pyridoxal phosphate-dependent enzyme [Candidatus Hydrogenedentota bacterium]
MRVLVTGGSGYLGCRLVPRLLEAGWAVRVVDRGCYGHEGLAPCQSRSDFELLEGDVRRLQELGALLSGVDAVIHLAGLANDPSCDLDPDMAWDVNVESTLELARGCVQAGVGRFILASSCSVYGQGVFEWLDEASPANPVSAFARTKLAAEQGLLAMASESFSPVVVRAATLFGVSPRMRFDLAINQMAATALRHGRIEIRGGGGQWRPFLHVDDAARGYLALLNAPESFVGGQIFNLGRNDLNVRVSDLAGRVASHVPGTAIDRATDDDDRRTYRVNFDKVHTLPGFQCARTIDHGIEELLGYIRTMEDNPFSEAFFNAQRVKRLLATPVSQGGDPVAARFVPLSRPSLGVEEEQAVLETLRSGWLTSGHHIAAFEAAFSRTIGARHTVAVTSCTAAIHLALVHLGIKPGDEVITPPITWASTGNTLLNMGARVVFADVDPETLNLDPAAVEAAITERTRAIIPVHLAGHPCDMDALRAVAARHKLPLIEDAAHALGAAYRGVPVGADAQFGCFSFYSIKNITTMEGGMLAVEDAETAAHLRALATNGLDHTAWDRYGRSAIARPLEVHEPGFKYLMGNVSAAMGVEQLKKFAAFKAARQRLARMYTEVLKDVPEIRLPAVRPDVEHAWHLFVIRLNLNQLTRNRDEIAYELRQENIGTGVHFHALHLHAYYREVLGMTPESLPVATAASQEILSLPLHPQLSDRNVHEVVSALKKVLQHAKK